MANVVILGAGIGGMPAAYELRETLDPEHSVSVINASEKFQFVPSNPWIAVGWRTPDEITMPIRPALEKRGIGFIAQTAAKIVPSQNRLILVDGSHVAYDYLVIATGPKLAFDEVPGSGPHGGHTHSICTVEHAQMAHDGWEEFLKQPGPIVIGAMAGASCFGPAYEFAFIVDAELRKRRLRHKVPMTFVTSEPYIGHLGLGGVGNSQALMEDEMRAHHIKWIANAMDISAAEKCPNIYSAGVCIAIPSVEVTPVPTGAPKTGYMIETMVTAIAHNIKNAIEGRQPDTTGTWNAICLADMDNKGVAFIAIPQIRPRNVSWMKKGRWVHWSKIAFEKYFLRKMRKSQSEPLYERYFLKALGITRLA